MTKAEIVFFSLVLKSLIFSHNELDYKGLYTRVRNVTVRRTNILSLFQAPFYPIEAERKGATATEYGLVFGVFELTVFLVRYARFLVHAFFVAFKTYQRIG